MIGQRFAGQNKSPWLSFSVFFFFHSFGPWDAVNASSIAARSVLHFGGGLLGGRRYGPQYGHQAPMLRVVGSLLHSVNTHTQLDRLVPIRVPCLSPAPYCWSQRDHYRTVQNNIARVLPQLGFC